ncbi:MAG: integrase core domain-containing protein [Planctomycetes bacterium]|nr:integrase core domain-containing protein [Planctomycetota bacterium]
MADAGCSWRNGYAERVIRTVKEEEVYLSEYMDFDDAYARIGAFIEDVYYRKRIHSALGYRTSEEFEKGITIVSKTSFCTLASERPCHTCRTTY